MPEYDLNKLVDKELATLFATMSDEELTHCLETKEILQDDAKVAGILEHIDNKELLERIGQKLTAKQFNAILENLSVHIEAKVPALLVGLKQETFENALLNMSDKQFQVLKLEGLSEPVQHHLTLLVHTLEALYQELITQLTALENRIDQMDPNVSTQEEIPSITLVLKECKVSSTLALEKIQRSLSITWSTGNVDLIETFNTLQHNYIRIGKDVIGHKNSVPMRSTGLYGVLEEKLFGIYGNPSNPKDTEALHDDEPALEGLIKFSVWYLEDYWDLGLLPKVASQQELRTENHTARDRFFLDVKENLEKIGLRCVKDLKDSCIFSKNTLKEHIMRHRHLLS